MVAKQWSHLVFLQCQIYFPLHFSLENYWDGSRILWGSQEFLHSARQISQILLNLSLKFSSLLFFSFSGASISRSLSIVPLGSPTGAPHCWLSHMWFADLTPLGSLRGRRWRPDPDHCLLHHLCSHQLCQDGTSSSHCKQNPTGWICQECYRSFSPPLGLLLVGSKQMKSCPEERGVLGAQPVACHLMPCWSERQIWTDAVCPCELGLTRPSTEDTTVHM